MADADDLRAQYEQAERLVREAQRVAEEAAARTVPPRGWSVPGEERSSAASYSAMTRATNAG